jgi:hypothetical protein
MSTFAFKHTYKGLAQENTDKLLFSNTPYTKLEYITIKVPLSSLSSMISYEDIVKSGLIRLNISNVIQELDCLDNFLLHSGQTFVDDANMIHDSILKSISEIVPPDSILNFVPASMIKESVTNITSDDLSTLILSGPISNLNSKSTESALTNLLFQLRIANLITLGNTREIKSPQFADGDSIVINIDYTPRKSISFSLDSDIAGVGNILQTESIKIGGRTIFFGKSKAITADGTVRYLKIKFVGVQNFTTSRFLYPAYSNLANDSENKLRFLDVLDMIVRIESERITSTTGLSIVQSVLTKIDEGFAIISGSLRLSPLADTTWYGKKYNDLLLKLQQKGQSVLPAFIQEYERLTGFLPNDPVTPPVDPGQPGQIDGVIYFPTPSISSEIGSFKFGTPRNIIEIMYFPDPSIDTSDDTVHTHLDGVIQFPTPSISSEIGSVKFGIATQTIGGFYFP